MNTRKAIKELESLGGTARQNGTGELVLSHPVARRYVVHRFARKDASRAFLVLLKRARAAS